MDVANFCWYGAGEKDAEFGGIGGDAGGIDDVAQIKNLVAKELTLRRFEFETCAEDTSEDSAKIVEVLSKATRKQSRRRDMRGRFGRGVLVARST